MENKIRLRFAPSPTGFLHIGSLRTVLFSYIIAKKLKGKLILRIEDTDQKREVRGATESLVKILDWVGLEFDEGPHIGGNFGPYIQTERLDIYNKNIEKLLKEKRVYRCFCSFEILQDMREKQQAEKLPPRYDRTCRDLSDEEINKKIKNDEKFVIRQAMPLSGETVALDEIRGKIKFKNAELDDHVLIKSNGIPTYQFASVVEDFRDKGYLPEALINFCGLLGWHPKDDNEILSLDEIIAKFELGDMGAKPAIFDIEKLGYFNGYYIRHKPIDDLVKLCRPYLEENIELTKNQKKKEDEFIKKVVAIEQERLKKISDITEATKFFFVDDLNYEKDILAWRKMSAKEAQVNLSIVYKLLEKIPEENWTNDSIEDGLMTYLQAKELRVGEYLWPMRVALCGQKASPGPFDIAEILGKSETMKRIEKSINLN